MFIKFIYHCSYLANIFYITYNAIQTVSVYFVVDYIRGFIYTNINFIWKIFRCKFMLSSINMCNIYYLLLEYYNCVY